MARVFIFLTLVSMLLAATALISVLSVENKRRIRGLPRFAWVLLIILVPLLGSIAYFLAGWSLRERRSAAPWPFGGPRAEPPKPKAPDDDPEFLRSLDRRATSQHEQDLDGQDLLRQREEELKYREDDRRRRDPGVEG